MPLSCYNTTDPNAVNLTQIFNEYESNGPLWRGGQPSDIVGCTATLPPGPSSSCVPCFNEIVHVICNNVAERFKLGMEAYPEAIVSFAETTCPTLLEPRTTVPGDLVVPQDRHGEETGGAFPWWIVLLIALVIISIICGLVYKKRRSILKFGRKICRRANPADTRDRPVDDDGVSEASPMNGESTTQV